MKYLTTTNPTQKPKIALQQPLVTSAMALLLSGALAQATIYRVKTDGNDANNGSTWALAKRTVGNALAAATAGDQVWVAGGTFNECVVLHDGVSLFGGFYGNENNLA